MEIIFNKIIEEFIDYCRKNKLEIYLVGGAIRDYFLGIESYDYDFTLTSDYDLAISVLENKYKCKFDNRYQSIKLTINQYQIEITHARIESNYFDYRHPSSIEFTNDIKLDSKRRDFTINALYYKDNVLYDFYNGIDDLKRKRLKVIGDTLVRFKEDPLRILRTIRFISNGYDIDKKDEDIIINNRGLLKELTLASFEKEFDKILELSNIYVLNNYKLLFEEYYDLKFNNLSMIAKLKNLAMKKTYLNIKNKSNIYKYRELRFSKNKIDLTKLIYKFGSEVIKELVEYHDIINDDQIMNVYNDIVDSDFYDKKQLKITSEEIISITNKCELTSYYIDKIAYAIINKEIENDKIQIREYIMEKIK